MPVHGGTYEYLIDLTRRQLFERGRDSSTSARKDESNGQIRQIPKLSSNSKKDVTNNLKNLLEKIKF